MALVGMELANGAGAQPLLQTVDEPGEAIGRGARLVHAEPLLPLGQGLGGKHVHGRSLEAEIGIEALAEAVEAQRDQAGDMLGVPARRGEPEVERLHLAIMLEACLRHDSEQQQPQDARADGIARKSIGQLPQQARRRLQHVLLAQDRLEEHGLRAIDGRRNDGDERLGRAPQRLVEAAQEFRLEARGKRRARLIDELADALEAEPAHEHLRLSREPERGERKSLQSFRFLARCHDPAVGGTMARHRPGRAGRAGDCRARIKPECAQAPLEIGQQPRLAAEEMRAPRDVEEQAVGAACLVPRRHDRRVAQAPERQLAQGGGIGGRIGIARLQVEHLGAGIGEQLAFHETALPRRAVEGDDARAALARRDEDERPACRRHASTGVSRRGGGLRAQQARDRPRPQPDGNDARHGSTR